MKSRREERNESVHPCKRSEVQAHRGMPRSPYRRGEALTGEIRSPGATRQPFRSGDLRSAGSESVADDPDVGACDTAPGPVKPAEKKPVAANESGSRKSMGYFLVTTAPSSNQKLASDAMFLVVGGVL